MIDMNSTKLQRVFEQYSSTFERRFKLGGMCQEWTKWKAADAFRKWEPDAVDRFKPSVSWIGNMIDIEGHLPLYGTMLLLKDSKYLSDVQNYFRDLFQNGATPDNVLGIAEEFVDRMNGVFRNARYDKVYRYDLSDATVLLTMKYPNVHFIYKPTCAKAWIRYAKPEYSGIFDGTNDKNDPELLNKFYDLCEWTLCEIQKRQDVLQKYEACMEELSSKCKLKLPIEDGSHILVYDLMYFTKNQIY